MLLYFITSSLNKYRSIKNKIKNRNKVSDSLTDHIENYFLKNEQYTLTRLYNNWFSVFKIHYDVFDKVAIGLVIILYANLAAVLYRNLRWHLRKSLS